MAPKLFAVSLLSISSLLTPLASAAPSSALVSNAVYSASEPQAQVTPVVVRQRRRRVYYSSRRHRRHQTIKRVGIGAAGGAAIGALAGGGTGAAIGAIAGGGAGALYDHHEKRKGE